MWSFYSEFNSSVTFYFFVNFSSWWHHCSSISSIQAFYHKLNVITWDNANLESQWAFFNNFCVRLSCMQITSRIWSFYGCSQKNIIKHLIEDSLTSSSNRSLSHHHHPKNNNWIFFALNFFPIWSLLSFTWSCCSCLSSLRLCP